MPELVPCDICGVIPTLQKSHSSRMVSHRCKDFHSGWKSKSEVVAQWNDSNSQNTMELGTTPNTCNPKLPPCGCWGAVAKAGLIHDGCNYCPKCGRQLRVGA